MSDYNTLTDHLFWLSAMILVPIILLVLTLISVCLYWKKCGANSGASLSVNVSAVKSSTACTIYLLHVA